MSTTAQLSQLPVQVLKQILKMNNAATYGTREQLVERIESGQQEYLHGSTPLHWAAMYGRADCLTHIIY